LLARVGRVKKMSLFPDSLPFRFELIEWIWFAALAAHAFAKLNRWNLKSRIVNPTQRCNDLANHASLMNRAGCVCN
jgi:hypothetical protein